MVDSLATPSTILLIGVTGDLSRADVSAQQVAGIPSDHVYVRFNVARAVRRQEHDDLVSGFQSAVVVDTDS